MKGINRHVAAHKITYGPREAEVMNMHIAVLLDLGHIEMYAGSGWLSKVLLAIKNQFTISRSSNGGFASTTSA